MKKFSLLFAFLLTLLGGTRAWAQTTEQFSTDNWPEGWSLSEAATSSDYYIEYDTSNDFSYPSGRRGVYGQVSSGTTKYIITPVVTGSGSFKFKRRNSSNGSVYVYTIENGSLSSSYIASNTSKPTSFTTVSFSEVDNKRLAIVLNGRMDDFTYTPGIDVSAGIGVYSDSECNTKVKNGIDLNFGLVSTVSSQTYYIKNESGSDWSNLSISHTGNATLTTINSTLAKEEVTSFTITQAASGTTNDVITITAGEDLSFTVKVSGTVKESGKLDYDYSSAPDNWTIDNAWSFNGAASIGSSQGYMYSPQIKSTGETVFLRAKKTNSSSWNGRLSVSWATNGNTFSANWTEIDLRSQLVYNEWVDLQATIPAAAKFIRISGSYVDIDFFYGLCEDSSPMLTISPTSYDFGLIDQNTTSTAITITNSGTTALTGMAITSDNQNFTVSVTDNASTITENGGTATFNVTMLTNAVGAQNATITISSDNADDLTFTVKGAVAKAGTTTETFDDNAIPTGWSNVTNVLWTFSNGEAFAPSSSYGVYGELATRKLALASDDFLAIKIKAYSSSYGFLKVYTSSDGTTWSTNPLNEINYTELSTSEYKTVIVSGFSSDIKYLKFQGYRVYVDEIAGLTYASVLTVTKAGATVSTPDSYDFGECTADATVTYNFTNAGVGTINITGVAITGDGAAAYSTNWTTSVATPFDLTITRTYDATRTGAQDAVVTVTTTDGDFIINVTGTDKAANAPELAVSPAEDADFGVVTAATEKTYTVTNAGTGLLTVNIYSNDAKFTVAPAQLTDIAAGESQTFTVTFTPVAGTYGTFTAEIVVIPTYDGNAAVPFNASAKVKDPNVWSEDFSGNALPTGWNADSNWSFDTGVAKATYGTSSTGYKNYLTTPTLTVSDATEELTFDYSATANFVAIKIQMSKDGAAFVDYAGYPSSLNNGNSGTFTITGLEPGNYQFRFANDDYELDNFEGFKLNLADHICTISDSNIPASSASSPTMKVGKSFDATVTVKELRGVAEALTAKLFMGDEVIGTATGNVAANGTETLTIVCTPTTDGYKAMHIEVEYAGGVLTTTNTYRSVAALTYLTLDETSSDAIVAGTYDNVTLKRTFIAGWNTVCLPFDINDVEAFFGTGAKAYEFSSYSSETGLNFSTVSKLNASYPYIVYVATAIDSDINLTDVEITSTNKEPWYTRKTDSSNNALYFRGTYAPMAAGTLTGMYGVTDEAKIVKGNAEAHMNGFRAYFELTDEAATARILFDGEDVTTSIDNVNVNDNLNKVYNLNGQKVQKAQKGLYIVNGKKVVVK